MRLKLFSFFVFISIGYVAQSQIIQEADPNYNKEDERDAIEKKEEDTVQYYKALKVPLARFIAGDFGVNFEVRTFKKQSVDLGVGLTRPWRSDPQNRFPGQHAPRFGWSASGAYRFYLGEREQMKGFSFEVAYRYQYFNVGVDEFQYSTTLSEEGHSAIYHHFNGIMAYQIGFEKLVLRAYFGLGLFDRTTYTVEETEGGEVDELNNQLLTNYEHAVRKVVTRFPSVKSGIDIGFRW